MHIYIFAYLWRWWYTASVLRVALTYSPEMKRIFQYMSAGAARPSVAWIGWDRSLSASFQYVEYSSRLALMMCWQKRPSFKALGPINRAAVYTVSAKSEKRDFGHDPPIHWRCLLTPLFTIWTLLLLLPGIA